MKLKALGLACVMVFVVAASASAQWRGLGRAAGKVVDEAGTALADVTVRADLLGVGGTTVKTNEKGEWVVNGIAKGEWQITLAKDGMVMIKTKVTVQEMAPAAFAKTTMKKATA